MCSVIGFALSEVRGVLTPNFHLGFRIRAGQRPMQLPRPRLGLLEPLTQLGVYPVFMVKTWSFCALLKIAPYRTVITLIHS
jgi:hypothetical protein